ncbi:ATP/GTP-binding protein [Runella sp.]|uniref:AAA family ATPase n=1 Tax=Runella sp. TaxID=1960881 RepID=UPI0026178D6E|nr:ATP-binding protein [Runella sp.]
MIIEFAVTNFRSIKERQILTFKIDGQIGKAMLPEQIVLPKDKSHGFSLVTSAVVYGANASGKSNFLKALHALNYMVENSTDFKLDKPIPTYEPFKLDRQTIKEPTKFEIDFIAKDLRRYTYEIVFNRKEILDEELYFYELDRSSPRKALLYNRLQNKEIVFGENYKGRKDFSLNPNQLFLSKSGVDDIPSIKEAYRFFSTYLLYAAAQTTQFDEEMLKATERIFKDESSGEMSFKEAIISIIKASDTGINSIFLQDIDISTMKFMDDIDIPNEEKEKILSRLKTRIKTVHPLYEKGIKVGESIFDLSEESTGTMKLLGLAGIIVYALKDGSVIIIDELDKNLHPLLTRMIVSLFHNPIINKNNAQLIFSTHDVSLIDKDLFRRDQIILVDKDEEGKSGIKRLSDFVGISKIIPLAKWYMAGMFKGIPSINEYQISINE